MNDIELAELFVAYAKVSAAESELRAKIEQAILNLGESKTIAGVKATYYNPTYGALDYEGCAKKYKAPEEVIARHSTTKVITKWQAVCDEMNYIVPMGELKPARVVVKVE